MSASALTDVNYTGLNDVSAATVKAWFDEGYNYNKKVYTGGRDFGLDPRAWATLLVRHTPSGYYFNDYPAKLSPTWSQATSDQYIVAGIRIAGDTVGAMVDHGQHAFDVIGFQTDRDPLGESYTLYGFYVIDPWYNGTGWSANGATYDLAPNTYRTISDWNSHYFLTYTVEDTSPATWHNEFVVILRTADSVNPTDYPGPPYSDAHGGLQIPQFTEGTDPAYPVAQLQQAVVDGLHRNGLVNSNGLGVRISHPTVGNVVFVQSVLADYPSYYLAEIRDAGKTVALATVNVAADGLHFAAVVGTGPAFRLPNIAGARAAFASRHFNSVATRLVWGWSTESMSPFAPIWEGVGPDGSQLYLAPHGEAVSRLHLLPRNTPAP